MKEKITTKESSTSNQSFGTTPTMDAWVRKVMKGGIGGLGNLASYFSNPTDDWTSASAMARGVAEGEGGYLPTALDSMLGVARGDYLTGGQGFDEAVDAAYRKGMPQVLSAFGAGGRSDGGLAKAALAEAFSDPFSMMWGQNLDRMMAASEALPGMAMMPSEIMRQVAGDQDMRMRTTADIGNSILPWLTPFIGSEGFNITDTTGSSKTSSKTKGGAGSPVAGGIGGALAGAGTGAKIGTTLGGPGIGTVLGGLAGGIGGLFQ